VAGFYLFAFVLVALVRYAYVVDTIVLRSNGVDYHCRMFQWQHQTWRLIDPTPRGLIELGYVTFRIRLPNNPDKRFRRTVGPLQARAILSDPRCPRRPISASRLRRLGMPADWPPSGSLH